MYASIPRNLVHDSEQVEVVDSYTKAAKANVASYKKKTTRQKYAKTEAYVAFRSAIWVRALPAVIFFFPETRLFVQESQHPGTPMPPITEQIPRGAYASRRAQMTKPSEEIYIVPEQGDNSDEDDDLEIGGVTQNYLCPITLTLLVDPYTSYVHAPCFSCGVHGGRF